jgi:hypothetical protein
MSKFCQGLSFLFAGGLVLTPHLAHGQSRASFVVDATVGAAQGRGGEFTDRETMGGRVSLIVSRSAATRLSLFGEVSMDVLGVAMGHTAVCIPNPRGGCLDSFPELSGPAALVGVSTESWNRRLQWRVGVGGGAYAKEKTRVGALISHVDGAILPTSHVGMVLGARWVVIPRFQSDRLSLLQWSFGVRIR